jgi:hypothetical protein
VQWNLSLSSCKNLTQLNKLNRASPYLWTLQPSKSELLNNWRSVSQSVSQSVCLGIERPCGTCDQILLPVGVLLSEISGLIPVRHLLWREDGSAICSVITEWSESRRTRNHTLLSHLRLPQPGRPGSLIYIPQEQGGPVIPPITGFPSRCLLRLASDDLQGYCGGI